MTFSGIPPRFWCWSSTAILVLAILSLAKTPALALTPIPTLAEATSEIPVSPGGQPGREKRSARSLTDRLKALNLATLQTTVQGQVGIGVRDLKTGESWFYNGKQRFPLQSVFKLPLGIAVLKQVDIGTLSLEQPVTVTQRDFAPGWSPLLKDLKGNQGQFTVRDLLTRSVGMSDNTAADVLSRLVGGPEQVTTMLQQMNLQGLRIDRLERQLQPDCVGLTNFTPALADEQKFAAAVAAIPDTVKRGAVERYLTDPRDTTTPEGMVDLLAKLHARQLLSKQSTALLLQIMTASPTGQQRLKAGLPPGWTLAHKTGTGLNVVGIGTATNDVGIVTSPTGDSVAIAVLIAGSKAPMATREKLMADVASAVAQVRGKSPD